MERKVMEMEGNLGISKDTTEREWSCQSVKESKEKKGKSATISETASPF